MNIHAKDVVQVMAGQFKSPFSQEEIQSSKYMTFIERSMINNIVPGRSPGVMVHGHTEAKVLQYGVSVQNDEGELGLNRNGGPDFFGQGRYKPWREGALETFSFGGAIGFGKREQERFVSGRTSSRSVVYFDKVPLDGNLLRRNVEAWWYPGPLSVQSEYDDLRAERNGLGVGGGDLPDVKARGFMVQAAYVLTGETNDPDEPIVPSRPIHARGAGAWEVGLRYQFFDVEGTERANRVEDVTVAVNWWFNGCVCPLPGERQLGDVPSPTEPNDHGNDELRFPDPPESLFLISCQISSFKSLPARSLPPLATSLRLLDRRGLVGARRANRVETR